MSDAPVPPPPPAEAAAAPASEDNTVAFVSYLFGIGFIVALIMYGNNKTQLGAYHLRQALGLLLTGIAGCIALTVVGFVLMVIPVLGWLLAMLFWFAFGAAMLVLSLMGFLAALNRQAKPVPVVGTWYQSMFAKAFV